MPGFLRVFWRSPTLEEQHTHAAIRSRIDGAAAHSYLGDFVLGAIDGAVTTFAIVAGVAGAGFGAFYAMVLGLANLLADGFSMAASNYLSTKADRHVVDQMRKLEEHHVEHIPEGEREEIRQIYAAKGFEPPLLEQIVEVITQDRRRWVDTMLTDEWGLQLDTPSPIKAASVTFAAFVFAGFVPLLPYCLPVAMTPEDIFLASSLATAATFVVIGLGKGLVVRQSLVLSVGETLLIGSGAAALAFLVGHLFKEAAGA